MQLAQGARPDSPRSPAPVRKILPKHSPGNARQAITQARGRARNICCGNSVIIYLTECGCNMDYISVRARFIMSSHSHAKKLPRFMWLQPDGSVCQSYIYLAGMTLLCAAYWFIISSNLIQSIVFVLIPGMIISYLFKWHLWDREQIDLLCSELRVVARQPCLCERFPEGYQCIACRTRGVLEEHFPDKLSDR